MARAAVGAVAIADAGKIRPDNGQRMYDLKSAFSDASTWSYIWLGVSITIIAGLYFGFGGYKGDVAS